MKIRLWKVKVNEFGWIRPKTLYFKSREAANSSVKKFYAHDAIVFAGSFSEDKAIELLDYTNTELDIWG